MALELVINGQPREFEELAAGATVQELIEALGLKGDRVALELNGQIAARAAWGETALAGGDKVEVVHFVGGGSAGSLGLCQFAEPEVHCTIWHPAPHILRLRLAQNRAKLRSG